MTNCMYTVLLSAWLFVTFYKVQEGRAVAGDYRGMQGTCTESLHLILGQRSEYKEH